MATFAAVNTTFSAGSPGKPAPEHAPATTTLSTTKDSNGDESSPNTPTRHNFGGMTGQRPLPENPTTPTRKGNESQESDTQARAGAVRAAATSGSTGESQDVAMYNGEDDETVGEDDEGSGNESTTSETQRPSKKKKGQRFFCTEFPPCQLSFTRSEHLARHIRKHTGERPFQCHCSRRFSRLDNLRQHAQTVHVNEEIPGDSLAAQSTRFQRQIRTDRVRPAGSRSRASTIGSQGGHSRGHSRNLSTSSIGSTASSVSLSEDTRRRPQPLAMANDGSARARLSLDTFGNVGASPGSQYTYYMPSSSGYSTPTSTTFSTGNASPQFQPAVISPPSSLSRSSVYNGSKTHARRLSVPSTQNPFHNPSAPPPPPYFSPMPPSSPSVFSPSNQGITSPTSSVFSHSRQNSETEMDIRRRTWHPTTNPLFAQRPATSGLTYHQTPDEPRPAFSQQPAASQMTRLPGIESFDHAPPPGPRQQASPMMVDATPRPLSSGRPSDAGLSQGSPVQTAGSHSRSHSGSTIEFVHSQHMSMPEGFVTPRKNKRNAWYGGPVGPAPSVQNSRAPVRTSPEDSGSSDGISTPSLSHATEFHPVIVHHHGMHESSYPPTGAVLSDEQQKAYYNSAEIPRKAMPTRSDSGFHGVVPAPSAGPLPPPPHSATDGRQHHDHNHQQHPQHPHQQMTAPSTPHQQQMYALQAGHDPRLAHTNYHHHQPSGAGDMAKLDMLVAVATSQNRAVEHGS